MDLETIKFILKTRLEVARENGNSTEESLIISLLELSDEIKELRKSAASEDSK